MLRNVTSHDSHYMRYILCVEYDGYETPRVCVEVHVFQCTQAWYAAAGGGRCMHVCVNTEREKDRENLANQASQSQDENEFKLSNFRQKMN